jgi:phospholipid transport system transporter-binding protein
MSAVNDALPASLTLRDAVAVLDGLRQSFDASSAPVWQLDASALVQVDTSALAVLLECARLAKAGQRRLEIVSPPARLSDLAQLYGVDGLLGLPAPRAGAAHSEVASGEA